MSNHIISRDSRIIRDVYFVGAPKSGLIKIGVAADADARFDALRTGSPEPLDLLLVIPGTAREESALHHHFRYAHSHREWFVAVPELCDLIVELRELDQEAAFARVGDFPCVKLVGFKDTTLPRGPKPGTPPSQSHLFHIRRARRRSQRDKTRRLWSSLESMLALQHGKAS